MALSSSSRVTRAGHECDAFVTLLPRWRRPRAPAQWGALQQNRRMLDPRVSEGSRGHPHLHYSFRAQRPVLLHKSRSRRVPTLRVGPDLAREWQLAEACGPEDGFADRLPPGRRQPSPHGWVHGVFANPSSGPRAGFEEPNRGQARSHTHRVWPSLRTQNRLCSKIIATTAQEQEELHA